MTHQNKIHIKVRISSYNDYLMLVKTNRKRLRFSTKNLSHPVMEKVFFLSFYQLMDLIYDFGAGRGFIERGAGSPHFLQTVLIRQQIVNGFRAGGTLLNFYRHVIVN